MRIKINNNTSKLYTCFLVVMPSIAMYKTPVPGFNAAELIFLLFFLFWIRDYQKENCNNLLTKSKTDILLFLVYLWSIPMLMSILFGNERLDVLIRTIRISYYFIIVALLSKKYLKLDEFRSLLQLYCIVNVLFLLTQYVSYYIWGTALHGFIRGIPLYDSSYETLDYSKIYHAFLRPSGLFLEPAHCARFLLIGLCCSFFKPRKKITPIIISFGVILTTSGQGLLILVGIWGLYILNILFKSKSIIQRRNWVLAIVIVVPLLLICFSQFSVVQNTVRRITSGGSLFTNGATQARFGTIKYAFGRGFLVSLFGSGYGSVPYNGAWMSGITYILFGSGLLGLLIILSLILNCIRNGNLCSKYVSILISILLISDDSFNNYIIIVFLSLMILVEQNNRKDAKNTFYCN